jgi:hypothetical protein
VIPVRSFNPRSIASLALWLDGADTPGQWLDKSGNSRNAVQLATNNQPAISTLNGRAALSFDGINDTLALGTVGLAAWHAFVACSPTNSGAILFVSASSTQSFTLLSTGSAGVITASGSPSTSSALYGVDSRIGARWDQGALKDFYKGLVGEVIVYSSALSAGQANAVTRYLSRKWGV